MRSPSRRRPTAILAILALILATATMINIDLGSTRVSVGRVATALLGQGEWIDNLIIFQLRLPRLVASLLIGAGVATAGLILQGITRNDLASPDTVGVNAGSGLGMMFLLVAYPKAASALPWLVPVGAMVGAIAVTLLVFVLTYRRGLVLPSRLLLVGIAVGFGAHAAMFLLSLRMSFSTYNFVVTWMSGSIAGIDWKSVVLLATFCLVLTPLAVGQARVLNAFALGEDLASSLGVAVERRRFLLLGIATMLTGVCVAVGGHIGFLGLAAPHLARRLVGYRHGMLFPAAALCGAILLVLADGLGRELFAPAEMPAGVLVGIMGGVYFLYLLATTKG